MADIILPSSDKVQNHGATEDGRLYADEWNALVNAVGYIANHLTPNEDLERRVTTIEQELAGMDAILGEILFN